jgi:acyl transferase domain-containing protein
VTLIDETGYTQPALFALQAGLVELWRSWGIRPDVVLGHSVGEFAAAYCAGVYTLEEALGLIGDRARLMQSLPRDGIMASVFAGEAAVAAAIEHTGAEDVAIAAFNGPQYTVVSGARLAVTAVTDHLDRLGTRCRPLNVSHAFHSPLMRPAADAFSRVAAALRGRPPTIPWVSTVSATTVSGAPGAPYWRDHALEPVRFAQGMQTLGETGVTHLLEIGPGSALLALGRQCLNGTERTWLGSLAQRAEWSEILSSLGELYRGGYEVDWDGFNRPFRRRRVSLPTYRFERSRIGSSAAGSGSTARQRQRRARRPTVTSSARACARRSRRFSSRHPTASAGWPIWTTIASTVCPCCRRRSAWRRCAKRRVGTSAPRRSRSPICNIAKPW